MSAHTFTSKVKLNIPFSKQISRFESVKQQKAEKGENVTSLPKENSEAMKKLKSNSQMPKLSEKHSNFMKNIELSHKDMEKSFTPRTLKNNTRTSETFSAST